MFLSRHPNRDPKDRFSDHSSLRKNSILPKLIRYYVRSVDTVNFWIGWVMMYGLFVIFGVLLWSSISKTFFLPSLWTLEIAQFAMVAYYILGGPFSLQIGANVRMDLFYGGWTDRKKAWFDAFSILLLIFYLGVLLYGAIDSTTYSLQYNERSPTAWRPLLWPIKIIMCVGIFLMLLQAISEFFKDIAKLKGKEI